MGLRTDLNGLRLSRKGRKVREGKNSTEERFEGVKYSGSYIHIVGSLFALDFP